MKRERKRRQGDSREKTSKPEPTVVGIGASAGGLAALKTFFNHVPADSGVAFVVVVHLSPEHPSHLPDLLQPHVRFPVQQVTENTALEPNHVYVIPPNANISTIDTHLRLSKLEEQRRERAPIDHFFRTLATTHDGHAIGVVLTGTGSDGTLGIKDIKAKGGLIIVQDPNDAEYDGMPQSAIATGLVDRILPVAEIPDAILRFDRTEPRIPLPEDGEEPEQTELVLLQKVFAHLRARTDRDFSRYKRSTLLRRIARRMQLHYVEDLQAYLEKLREQPDEVRALADDLLITVTSFFRDAEVFEKLQKEVIPSVFSTKKIEDPIRVWSVGCATGEEAYSLGILLVEEAYRRDSPPPRIQIFASDLHKHSLERARDGFYPGDIQADVSPERLKRFFQKENGGYRVHKELRDLIVFAPHNLLGDPPFSRLDLIACRNLLIYLQRDVQRDVIELFHYALIPNGALLLGSSETVEASDLFRTEDKKLSLYRKRNVPAPEPRLPVFPLTRTRPHDGGDGRAMPLPEPVAFGSLHQRMVERYAPPSLLISPDNKLVHLSEHAGRYLVHPGGELTANVVKLVRDELRVDLRTSLQTTRERKEPYDSQPIPVRFNGQARPVVLHVRPALEPDQDGFVLVIFEERESQEREEPVEGTGAESGDNLAGQKLQALESELNLSRQRLQAIIEEYEASQEEMKASNEEMQSTNEELRSTMEELETSKEELQSINEELQTVNQENRHKVEELAQLSSDLHNLLSATNIATLFLDRSLRILRFTPKVAELFNVRTTDRGRPISDLTHRLGYPELQSDAQAVLDGLIPVEREVRDEEGHWYLTRVQPYRSTEDRIEGIVITFVDITRSVSAERELRKSEERLSVELDTMQRLHGLVGRLIECGDLTTALDDVLESSIKITGAQMGTIQLLNPATNTLEIVAQRGFKQDFLDHFRSVTADATSSCGRAFKFAERVVVADVKNDPHFTLHREVMEAAGCRAVLSVPLKSRDDRVLGVLSTHYPEPHIPSERDLRMLDLYARQATDFVERRLADEELRLSEERYRLLVESAKEYAIFMIDAGGNITTWSAGAERIFGYTPLEIAGRPSSILFTEEDRANGVPEQAVKMAAQEGRFSGERWQVRKDGSQFWASGVLAPLRFMEGALGSFVMVLRDNTERKEIEEKLRAHQRDLRVANDALTRANADLKQFAMAASHDLQEPLRTVCAYSQLLIEASREGRQREAERAVQFITDGTDRMGQLLKDLLSYTELNAVEEEEVGNLVDLNRVADKAIENLGTAIERSAANVTRDSLPAVRGWEGHFIQLFQNLIDNALKYRNDQPPRVHLSAQLDGNDWRITISDNGMGIEEKFHKQIFGVFKRLHGKNIPGTGIGLAICQRVVERAGGRIWVESEANQGAFFHFTLPSVPEDGRG